MQAVHPQVRPMQVRPIRMKALNVRSSTPARRPSRAVFRRRRLAVLLCASAVALAGWFGLHQLAGLPGDGPLTVAGQPVSHINARLVTRTRVIVEPGDTLWSLARRAQPTGDVRPLVRVLDAQRHGATLRAGETVELPQSS